MAEALDLTNLPAGMVLHDKYRVEGTLGIGGMGVVVAAVHMALDSKVAIKFLLPQLVSNELVVQRFMREAKAAIRIPSEHVARVLDVGNFHGPGMPKDGVPFMVMEYLTGRDLGEWVQSGTRFSAEDAINYTMQAAEALAQAHRLGIIHRDIKPANLFLVERDDGRPLVKVLDFGISKVTQGPQDLGLTKTTTVLGSGLYMSPEQMRSAKSVDHRSDVYSLGVCLFELLSGTQPHTAQTFSELCVKVATEPPTPLRHYRPDISDQLAEAIAKAYMRNPDERYQTVQEMAAALSAFAGAPAVAVASAVQKITRAEAPRQSYASLPPYASVPPPASGSVPPGAPHSVPPGVPHSVPPGSGPALPVARSGQAVTAVTASATVAKDKSGPGLVTYLLAAVVIAGAAAGGFFLSRRGAQTTTEPATTASSEIAAPASAETATSSASVTAEPTATASATAEPTASASASATASASAKLSTGPVAVPRPPPPPPVVRPPPPPIVRPPPPPPPPKMCNRINPNSGMMEMVPCN